MATTYTVTQLNAYVGNLFREDFLLVGLRVQGEPSNVKYHASGHIYFTLKDSGAELRGVTYRQNTFGLDMRLADGMQVVCTGTVTVYERAGAYQLNMETVEKLGRSELYVFYQARPRALEAEGLFNVAHKKPLPRFVLMLGVVASPSDVAIHDIRTVARQQNPYVRIILYPALVQGEGMVESIVRGTRAFDRRSVDLMIVGRDGGSLEDFWCFNNERVAWAVYACETLLISAIGHESDVTLLDFIADLRVATPSAAAERGVPNLVAQLALIAGLWQQLSRGLRKKVGDLHTCARGTDLRLRLNAPEELLSARQQHTLALRQGLEVGPNKKIQARRAASQLLAVRLRAASPFNRLTGGCAYAAHVNGAVVQSAVSLSTGERFSLRFLDDVTEVRVGEIRRGQQEESYGRRA